MITTMRRDRTQPATPDLFATEMVRGASPPQVPATRAVADRVPLRHVLPQDLPNAVKHLSDTELDLLITALVEEVKRRGGAPPSIQPNSPDKPKRSISKEKLEEATILLTRGQISAVRAAFKAGITPSRIARQFGISQSDVRKVLASRAMQKEP